MIEKVTEKTTKYKSPDGVLHESAEAAESHHLAGLLGERSAFRVFDAVTLSQLARDLINGKHIIGPLLRVPVKRPRKAKESAIVTAPDAAAPAKTGKKK